MSKAAALSYYTIISIFPMILIGATILSQFFSQSVMLETLMKVLEETLPYHSELLVKNVATLLAKRKSFSWFGAIALLISAQILYVHFGKTVNRLIHAEKPRNFLLNRFLFLGWLLGIIVVLLAPVYIELAASTFEGWGWRIPVLGRFFARGGFVFMGFLIFLVVMLVMPTRRIDLKRLFYGGLFFALTLQGGKMIFKWMTLRQVDRYNLVYGSLSSMVLVTLWIFYFYNLLLFFVYWAARDHDPIYKESKS